ncbi:SDR family NAD(P)-dependent oxidoreductase [uncultured Desulfosarcina sp.]|uniref:SDR family NAD(P)-dependent oxidoreductase n=1 Tax=uncultured Desulfosarcina sp. TaxID=218289 RepID=UPI0029C89D65|nr:SDR family NAD(P)-dependent oxidoreductase [uncultured Desulfosarcina sp.]
MDRPASSEAIAVIGLACYYPDAASPAQLWENILARRRQFRKFPDCRLPLADYYDSDKKAPDKTYGRQAAFIDGFAFDWAERRIPLSTVQTTDIVHWLALETSLQAVADAGYTKDRLPGRRTGVIVGNTLTGEQTRAGTMRLRWPFVRRALHAAAREQGMADSQLEPLTRMLKERYTAVFPPVDEDTLAGGLSNTIAGRICNHLDLMGGGFTIDGACSSSLLAAAHAASRLADGDLDLAIVGGVDISLDPFELIGFAKTGALTDDDMTVYDRGGKGFIPGEGCGFMVLKPLDAARRDGDRVYAVIHGWGISSDGGGSGITAPNAAGQTLALERAYRHAPHGIQDLDFIEGHGTGTTVGDRTELEAIARAMGRQPVSRGQLRPCGITSLKSIIGHTKAASGIGGLIKAVMAVNRRVIPPTAACRNPHQAFDSDARRLYPVRLGRKESGDRSLTAGVSSMGFGGINCHITLVSGDAPDRRLEPALDEGALMAHAQETELFVMGADNKAALLETLAEVKRIADGISMAEMADLSADLTRRVPPDASLRAAIVAGHPDDLLQRLSRLKTALQEADESSPAAPDGLGGPDIRLGTGREALRIGFLFPGQGSQQFNMARNLVQRFSWAREWVDQADRITRGRTGTPVSRLIYRDTDRAPDPEERDRWFRALSRTENAQPAICLASLLWLEYLRRLGIRPAAVGGHSLGELSACFAGGLFDGATLLDFAARRGHIMSVSNSVPGAMVGLRCDEAAARDMMAKVDGYIAVANLNSPRQTVLSGETTAVEGMLKIARENGIDARMLPVTSAFHSRLCEDAARQVGKMALLDTASSEAACLIFSSIDGDILKHEGPLRDHFSRQIRSRVNFMAMVRSMTSRCDVMIEVGPGRVLTGLVGDLAGQAPVACLPVESSPGNATDLNRVLALLFASGVPISWQGLFENRLIRPFVPAAEKSFVANPCEAVPRSDGSDGDVSEKLPAVLAEAFAGVPAALVSRYLASRGEFLNRVVQADLSFWDPDARPAAADERQQPEAGALGGKRMQEALYGLVAEATGFSPDSLTRKSRLLDDLNLDSIKAGDLIARFAKTCGIAFPDPALLANAALGELIDAATRLNESTCESAPAPPDALETLLDQAGRITGFPDAALDPDLPVERGLNIGTDKLELLVRRTARVLGIQAQLDIDPLRSRSLNQIAAILDRLRNEQQGTGDARGTFAGQPTWVRNFSMDLVETPYPRFPDTWRRRSEDDWQKARVLILHAEDTSELAELLGQHLFQQGATIHRAAFNAETTDAQVKDAAFSHLLALLPKEARGEGDRGAFLKRMIAMRASIVAPPPAAEAPRRRTTVAYVQFGGGVFGRDPRFANPERCAAMALAASLHLERSDLRVRVVDFNPALPAEVIAWETIAELTTSDRFAAVGYDLDRTRRTFFPRLIDPLAFNPRSLQWSPEDVILVTGGAKGITAVCALAVARKTGVRMALVGRTAHPDESDATSASQEIRTQLKRFAANRLTADYFSCDMVDRKAVDRLLKAVEARLGPVTGIIHGAGLNRPRLTGQVDPQRAYDETAPKVLGLLHLLDALSAKPPKLIVGMGSIIGLTGMPGNGWYGFSNETMDIALRGFTADHPETQTINVAYSIWRDEGMGARMGSVDLLREKGIDAIPTNEGVDRFLRLFTHDPESCQVVVTARLGGLDTWYQDPVAVPEDLRFLEKQVHLTPGVEAVFRAHLTLDSDPYLRDHNFQGSYLLPTVFGLEAMAQAAMFLTGRKALSRLQIRDVRLLRPITVDPQTGADIVIRAVVDESNADGVTRVRAGIVKEGTGVQSDSFSATLVFDPESAADAEVISFPDAPLPLVPETDLYRPALLFQGPRFQGIQAIREIRQNDEKTGTALFSSQPTPPEDRSTAAFGEEKALSLCLGDAFFTDTLLQSAALLVPQDTSLPVSIERLDLCEEFFEATTPARVRVDLLGREQSDLIYRVVAVGEDGAVRAVLDGYRLRILKHHEDYPTVTDLVAPERRDRQLIRDILETACRQLMVDAPVVDAACIMGLHDMPKARRREAQQPLLRRALDHACEAYGIEAKAPAVSWLDNGKPVVAGLDSRELDVSLTHEDRICLCALGPGPVGCDLATITPRSREGWRGLLGAGHMALFDLLLEKGESPDSAGTRVWAAMEALVKAGGDVGAGLRLAKKADDALLLAGSDSGGNPIQVLTIALRLTWGGPRILAVTVTDRAVERVPEHLLTADYPGYEPLYDTRSFEMIEGGPQGQLVFVQRLPVTFQPSANLSRTIYFSNYIKWMGHTREASAWPVLAEMSDQFASGRWGGVTNYGHLKILGEGGTSDRIEVLMWVSDNSGPENSTMTLSYDFRKMLPGGGFERLAFCRLQTTWVEILGPGVAKVAPYPAYYGQFIEDMCPRFDAPDVPEPLPEALKHLFEDGDDPVIYLAPGGPVVRPIVREQIFETTLAQANLVGNIYYANYYEWQGQIRDRFFYEQIPEYFQGIGEKGELLALESRVDHLREAMPFDRILLTLAIRELRACSVTFHVDYFRLEPDNSRVKIAYGMHRAAWTQRDETGRPVARPFPDQLRKAFETHIQQSGNDGKNV